MTRSSRSHDIFSFSIKFRIGSQSRIERTREFSTNLRLGFRSSCVTRSLWRLSSSLRSCMSVNSTGSQSRRKYSSRALSRLWWRAAIASEPPSCEAMKLENVSSSISLVRSTAFRVKFSRRDIIWLISASGNIIRLQISFHTDASAPILFSFLFFR